MPSGLVTVWIMHNKPPEEFTHTHTNPHALTLPVTIATLAMLLPQTSKSDVISASQQPEGAMVMTDYSPSDGSFLPSSLPFSSSTLPLFHSSAGSLLPPPA